MIRKFLKNLFSAALDTFSRVTPVQAKTSRTSCIERLEDRRVLAAPVDIVFIVDESLSDATEYDWVADIVNGTPGAGGLTEIGLDAYLTDPVRDFDPRYGLIGYGEPQGGGQGEVGHSHLLDPGDADSDGDELFGSAVQLAARANALNNFGSDEPVWDAGGPGWR